MVAEINNGKVNYHGADYKFKLVDEKIQKYTSHILVAKDIEILENKSDLSNKDLKDKIIETWFDAGNRRVKDRNKAKRRAKRAAHG
jgi:hypothetical protein